MRAKLVSQTGIEMDTRFDVSLLVKVAQMYYIEGLKQEDIARQLGISRSLISMILTEAREVGIVEISVRDPFLNDEKLSRRMQQAFKLKSCIVIPTSVRDESALRKFVAQRTVAVINSLLKNRAVIGLGWGRSCHQFVSVFRKEGEARDVSVVPLVGGSNQMAPYFQLNELVRILADKLGGKSYFVHAPSLVSSAEERDLFCSSSVMQPIAEKWRSMDIVVAGIGTLPKGQENGREIYKGEGEIYKKLDEVHVVGDLCARYFTVEGEFIRSEYYDRIVGVRAEDLASTKNVVCMAAGSDKAYAVLGALRTGVVNTLVCDQNTAEAVLALSEEV
ncbi:sugar-binding transcriptional regulator [Salinispira pacifica]